MTYEYDPIARPYPIRSTGLECKLLERESSLMSFQPLRLIDFLQSPLFVPSSCSQSRKAQKIHPLPSSCQDISEASSDEEEEEKVEDLARKVEITTTTRSTRTPTTTKRSAWLPTTTTRPTKLPEFRSKTQRQGPSNLSPLSCQQPNSLAKLSCKGLTSKDCGGAEIEGGGRRMRRKRLPRLSARASHLLQVR